MSNRILNSAEVAKATGLSRTTVWRKERRREFPQRLRISDGRVGWVEAEVVAWLDALPRGVGQPPCGMKTAPNAR